MTTTAQTPASPAVSDGSVDVSALTQVPIAAEAAAFRAAHGAPANWSAEEFDVYLDLERVPAELRGGEAA
ncbi:hypothetical protein [Streptomyces sp. NBC_01187]|uniref:hypothetical protein n=1 Tax=Streptomyces sp. NBC_01187 TaxID=2903766 RepID=UPI00386AB4CF|nr:hypothetical protein OG220_19335 [Streptomyces sp. NBC_01187]